MLQEIIVPIERRENIVYLRDKLRNKELIILDGAMGTMLNQLYEDGAARIPEEINILSPASVIGVHEAYLNAGSDIVLTNTFGANSHKLNKFNLTCEQIIPKAIRAARDAADKYNALVALDIGPLGQLIEPMGTLKFEDAYKLFKEQIQIGAKYNIDLIYIETMSDLYEVRAALLAAKEYASVPVFVTMSFDENGRTFSGCDASSIALTLEALGADAIGINCSLGPKEILPIIKEMSKETSLPLIAKPNAGLPKIINEQTVFNISADEFAKQMASFAQFGVGILGGCCGTTPEFIRLIKKTASNCYIPRKDIEKQAAICSGTKTLYLNDVFVIGERINPTGKKAMKAALINNDIGYVLKQAVEQLNAGAEILDVNVGIPDINQKDTMIRIIKSIQSISNAPLQIDSNDPEVIEAALRIYNGKAIVNSVTGEEQSLSMILPIIKKYGAAVIGLTLDNNGIPSTAQGRYDIAKKIVDTATKKYKIPRENIYIDCLALTISADSNSANITLDAIKMVKEHLGLNTVLGVSNISFGLPARGVINNIFLTMALYNGLNLPIINPNASETMQTVAAFKALKGIDQGSKNYISLYANNDRITASQTVQSNNKINNIEYLILNGISNDIEKTVDEMLTCLDEMKIINEYLIPILDKLGTLYENGKIFLPQLISSSEVAKTAFDYLNKRSNNSNTIQVQKKKKIILATVKGDVHDIGKNIVKVVLQNYGFEVIDLGYDTDIDLIVQTALSKNILLVGLSALMTTTLKSMEQTISALYKNGYKGAVMVGGAVLDNEYALKIGATFYAKNAQEAANIARKVFKKN